MPVLLEDANGGGESATGFVGADTTAMQLSNLPDNPPQLASPINVLFSLLEVSRGKSVANEILGSGDASIAGQEFVLKNSPLTYLLSSDSSAGGNYKSTLQVWVNGIQWHEAPSFFGQAKTAAIFVTREDEDNKTHVLFGDGVDGARLPSGSNNVVASYRFGSGADAPDAGKLTVIATPQPGLGAIHNPVPAGGGADPEPASQIRRYAPLSVLTFGRAVSGDDYEAIAALAPGVRRAHAYWAFDPIQQRTVVTVYVGDDASAVNAATVALRGDSDPNRPVSVKLATAVPLQISLTLAVDPKRVAADVVAAVALALSDPQTGLFGSQRIGVGEVIYVSRIYAACFSVPGVVAVHHLQVHTGLRLYFTLSLAIFRHSSPFRSIFNVGSPYRLDPGEGKYFALSANAVSISSEVTHA
jgi:predicted phage baseplate assembly protein